MRITAIIGSYRKGGVIDSAAGEERHDIGERVRRKARRLGKKLVAASRG